jgi:hypothetical protein
MTGGAVLADRNTTSSTALYTDTAQYAEENYQRDK